MGKGTLKKAGLFLASVGLVFYSGVASGQQWCPPSGAGAETRVQAGQETSPGMTAAQPTTQTREVPSRTEATCAKPCEPNMVMSEGPFPQSGTPEGPANYGQYWGSYPDEIALQEIGPEYFGPTYGAYGLRYGREFEWWPAGPYWHEKRYSQAEYKERAQAAAPAAESSAAATAVAPAAPQAGTEQTANQAIDTARAEAIFREYLNRQDPTLRLGAVEDKGNYFEAPVLNQQGCMIEKLQLDKTVALNFSAVPAPQTAAPQAAAPVITGFQQTQAAAALSKCDARVIFQNYLNSKADPNLHLDEIRETDTSFETALLDNHCNVTENLKLNKQLPITAVTPQWGTAPQAAETTAPPAAAAPSTCAPCPPCPSSGSVAPSQSSLATGAVPQAGTGSAAPAGAFSSSDAKSILRDYVNSRNQTMGTNWKLGDVRETDNYFEAPILDQNNNVVERAMVDKSTPHMITAVRVGQAPQAGAAPSMSAPQAQTGAAPSAAAISETDAASILQKHLNSMNDPNLRLGALRDRDTYFEAPVLDPNNNTVEKLRIDKQTRAVTPIRVAPQAGDMSSSQPGM